MQKLDGKRICVYMETRHLEMAELIAKKHEIKKAEAIRILLDIGCDTYEAYAKIGVPQLAHMVKKAKQAIRAAALEEKQPSLF